METKTEINELDKKLKPEYRPVKSPIVQLFEYFKNKRKRTRLREIEDLRLDIQKAKLQKELKEI